MSINKQKRKLMIWLFIPCTLILILSGLLYFYLNSHSFKENLKTILIDQIEKILDRKIEIGTIDSVSFQSLQFADFKIYEGSAGKPGPILFESDRVRVNFVVFLPIFHLENWKLNLKDMAFYQASASLTREINGDFDFLRKLGIDPEKIQENILIQLIQFHDSHLIYHDELVYNLNQKSLTTKAKGINGYFDLTQLPKISFNFQGIQENDQASLALQGYSIVAKDEYSLHFRLENADITHFQYYLEPANLFNVTNGQFDMDLHLSFSPDMESIDPLWEGNAAFKEANLAPDFLQEIPLTQVEGQVQFKKPTITLTDLRGYYRNRPTQLTGFVLTEPEVFFDLHVNSQEVNANQFKEDVSLFIPDYRDFSLDGNLELSASIVGNPENFQIDGKASSQELLFEETSIPSIECLFTLKQEDLIIQSLKIQEGSSLISLEGNLVWENEKILSRLNLFTENLNLNDSIFKTLEFAEDMSGSINSQWEMDNLSENPDTWNIHGEFIFNSTEKNQFGLIQPLKGRMNGTLDYPNFILLIENCELETGQSKGYLEGKIQFDSLLSFIGDFEFYIPDLSELTINSDFDPVSIGEIKLKGSIQGNSKDPELNSWIEIKDLRLPENLSGEFKGHLNYRNQEVLVEEFLFSSEEITLTGQGKISGIQKNSPEIDLNYVFNMPSLESAIQLLDHSVPLSGTVEGPGKAYGTWPELTLYGNFHLKDIQYSDFLLGNGQLEFNLISNGGQEHNPDQSFDWSNIFEQINQSFFLKLENLKLQNHSMVIQAKGESDLNRNFPFHLDLEFEHFSSNEMLQDFYPVNDFLCTFLPSQMSGKGRIDGDQVKQNFQVSLELIPQITENNPPSKLESSFSIQDQTITISHFKLSQTEGHLSAEGTIDLKKDININFNADQLNLQTLLYLMKIDENALGIMNVKGHLTGLIEKPNLSIIARIQEGSFRQFQFNDLNGDLSWNSQENEIKVNHLTIALEEDYQINAKGNLPLDIFSSREIDEVNPDLIYQEVPLDFQFDMKNASLDLLSLFSKDVFTEIGGNMDLIVFLTGTAGNPIVNGKVKIHQGRIMLRDYPIQIDGLDTQLEIVNNQIVVNQIPFLFFNNPMNISGKVELVGLIPDRMALNIRNRDNSFQYENILTTKANLLIEITGSILDPVIQGQVALSEGEINLNQLIQFEENGLIPFPYTESAGMAPFLSQDKFNVNIELYDPFTLKMTNAEIHIGGRLTLGGDIRDPFVQGNLALKKGYFLFFEKKFNINSGLITINGFTVNHVDLRAKANTNVQDVQIVIDLMGNLAQPQVLLSSQPALKETEILSLLTFDRNIQGLSEGEINQLLSQEMINILFQSLQSNLFKRMERELAEGLGLEYIRFSIDQPASSGNHFFILDDIHLEDLTLEVGKSFGDDILISYSTPLDFHGESSIGIEYNFSPRFTFNTQFETFSIKEDDYRFQFGLEIRF